MLIVVLLGGCRPKAEPSPKPSTTTGGNEAKTQNERSTTASTNDGQLVPAEDDFATVETTNLGNVHFVEFREINTDDLPAVDEDRLQDVTGPLRWMNGQLHWTRDDPVSAPASGDGEFSDFEFEAGPIGIQATGKPETCKMIVRYVVEFKGTRRWGETDSWWAFDSLQGEWTQVFATENNNILTYDPAEDLPPFENWLESLRWIDSDATTFQLDVEANPAQLRLGVRSLELPVKQLTDISRMKRSVTMTRLPLTSAAFDEESAPQGDEIILPGEEFGKSNFETWLTATYHGQVPLIVD